MKPELFDQNRNRKGLAHSAAAFIVAAGLIHLAIVPLHWGHAPAHALFFAVSGVAEIAWSVAFWRRPSEGLYRTGVVMAGGIITLWAMTRLLPAPFGHGPEEMQVFDIVCKLAEGLGLAALVALAVSGAVSRETRISAWRRAGVWVIASLIAGGLTYGVASAAEPMLPWLGAPAEHEHAERAGVQHHDHADTMQLVVGGIPQPFASGDDVPVAGDLVAKIIVSAPDDRRFSRNLDLYLRHQKSSDAAEDVTVRATGHMIYMDHGTFRQVALPSGGGHYVLPLQFAMPGEWQLDLDIVASGEQGAIQLVLDLFD